MWKQPAVNKSRGKKKYYQAPLGKITADSYNTYIKQNYLRNTQTDVAAPLWILPSQETLWEPKTKQWRSIDTVTHSTIFSCNLKINWDHRGLGDYPLVIRGQKSGQVVVKNKPCIKICKKKVRGGGGKVSIRGGGSGRKHGQTRHFRRGGGNDSRVFKKRCLKGHRSNGPCFTFT